LLIGNHYLALDTKVDIIKNYFNFSEKILDTSNYRVILLGDFNVPGFDWNYGLLSPNCHFYTKLKGDMIHSAICFLGLNQHNYPDSGSNLLGFFIFFPPNFADHSVDHAEYDPVQPDNFHPPLIIDCTMPVRRFKQNFNIFYKRFFAGDFAVLYNALST
jgi:hypothetical protein